MVVDCHVHLSAIAPAHGAMSQHLLKSLPFRFMRWRLGLEPEPERFDAELENLLARLIAETRSLDKVVVLAFDAVHDQQGKRDLARTHLYLRNEYVAEICKRQERMLFGASIHPYRKDAVEELERCVAAGAVLVKWLPIVQDFNPADSRCEPFYEALAGMGIPLLSHTGGENSLPNQDRSVADPDLLLPALKRGVKVIMAHCGTRSMPWEKDFLPAFVRLAREFEHCYGDTAALNLPSRSYAYETLLGDPEVNRKLVHGSDWPILPVPPLRSSTRAGGLAQTLGFWCDNNWLRRDLRIKEALGFDQAYWERAAKVLGLG